MSDSNKITKDKEPPFNQDKNESDFNDQNELDYEEDDLRQHCNNSSISRKCVEVIHQIYELIIIFFTCRGVHGFETTHIVTGSNGRSHFVTGKKQVVTPCHNISRQ